MNVGELVTTPIRELTLADQTTDALREQLSSLLARTADDLREMAAIVGELERRGEDLSGLKLGIIEHLRRIATGQLLPEIVVRFSGFPQLLRIAVHLPLGDQRRLIEHGVVSLACWRDGKIEFRRVDPLALSGPQVRQAFASDRIRSDAEQVSYLETHPGALGRLKRTPSRARVRADKGRGGVRIGRSFASAAEVLGALAELRGFGRLVGDDDASYVQAAVRISESELRTLKTAAAQGGCSLSDLIRRALWAAGLVPVVHTDSEPEQSDQAT